ncbi:YdcF family protein [Oxalobacter aliiformigenes]|uniref:YdcF family protein n=1 Tax=Oxalobacter aliiformigenes TaxID=2946593 RepID=A0ABY7JPN0_9BURK|nr:YdcF family protein [Oxalobacter aliiformigenes]WAV92314.1 YdcF family protein [Oxalobacter aliiformigenes]WAV94278.1 YdcF family protein [Oxalobacter aliiformigenes]WAV97909.1 YdcF family protein [Oxalobacter aliiformigenes]
MKKSLKILVIAAFVSVAYLFCSIALFSTVDQKKTADAAIILGAAAWYKRPSPVFQERIRHGIWLYENGYVGKLILTGGKSKNAPFSEAYVARRYALSQGIPEKDILIEEASLTTRENLINARAIMEKNGLETALVVSDPMHMKRAMQIAGDLGITAWSSPTPTTRYESFRAKVLFLVQETWHMIGYIIYPNGLPEWPAPGNGS